MLCHKLHNWLNEIYECPHNYDCETACNSIWVTLIGGTGVTVCPSCKLWILMHGYAERSHCEEKEDTSQE
jgi:hypothetical protein